MLSARSLAVLGLLRGTAGLGKAEGGGNGVWGEDVGVVLQGALWAACF